MRRLACPIAIGSAGRRGPAPVPVGQRPCGARVAGTVPIRTCTRVGAQSGADGARRRSPRVLSEIPHLVDRLDYLAGYWLSRAVAACGGGVATPAAAGGTSQATIATGCRQCGQAGAAVRAPALPGAAPSWASCSPAWRPSPRSPSASGTPPRVSAAVACRRRRSHQDWRHRVLQCPVTNKSARPGASDLGGPD